MKPIVIITLVLFGIVYTGWCRGNVYKVFAYSGVKLFHMRIFFHVNSRKCSHILLYVMSEVNILKPNKVILHIENMAEDEI